MKNFEAMCYLYILLSILEKINLFTLNEYFYSSVFLQLS